MLEKNTGCQFGYYGKDCTGRCSVNCYYTSRCDRFTGHCTEGCKAGWTGNMCDQRKFYIYACIYNLVIKKTSFGSKYTNVVVSKICYGWQFYFY